VAMPIAGVDGAKRRDGCGGTRRRRFRCGRCLTTGLGLVALLGAGCSGSGPVSPEEALVFQGTIRYQGSAIYNVSLSHAGLMEVTLSELRPILVDTTTTDPSTIYLGFAVGIPDGESCTKTGNTTLAKGGSVTIYLTRGDYCLDLFDVGLIPPDGVLATTLSVQPPK
jgi:hypothetical protein